jgi:hypothetical protein
MHFVDWCFKVNLAPTFVSTIGGNTYLLLTCYEHIGFEVFEVRLAGFNFYADAGIPRSITVFHKLRETSVPSRQKLLRATIVLADNGADSDLSYLRLFCKPPGGSRVGR